MGKKLFIAIAILAFTGLGIFALIHNLKKPFIIQTSIQSPNKLPQTQPSSTVPDKVLIYYPISSYNSRLTSRLFGQYISSSDIAIDCGRSFQGYHDADDLETFQEEKNIDVPVFAISEGIVRQVSFVGGYGGLLIIQTNIGGQQVTLNYGHISLPSAKVKAGDAVKAGQVLAFLGKGCSAETDGERKHLHFAIHKGISIDVRGYVPTKTELNGWLNPKTFFSQNNAISPKYH